MENKLNMMNELHPRLNKIVDTLNDITNMDDMKAAKQGGRLIKQTLEAEARERQEDLDEELGQDLAVARSVRTTKVHHHHIHEHPAAGTISHLTSVVHSLKENVIDRKDKQPAVDQ
jgi:hypothetical protein